MPAKSQRSSSTTSSSAQSPAVTAQPPAVSAPASSPASQAPAAGGLTGGAVSLDDFATQETGSDASGLDVAGARALAGQYDSKSLADWKKSFDKASAARAAGTKTDGRSTEEMLAAIAANTAPKHLARVGPKKNFTDWSSFGNGTRDFIFATEPADLVGCSPIEAMVKVGWTRQWIEKEVGSPIAVCVIDTSKSIPKTDAAGKTTNNKMSAGRFEWSELIPKATGDSSFVKAFKDTASADISSTLGASASEADITGLLGQILTAWSKTPVGSSPSMGGPAEDRMAKIVRGLLSRQYGANELYSGMGATISEQGDLGAREVMVENNGTGFGLTADNHVIVDLGTYTNADVDKALSPAPAGGP